ncbi:hypothetical protein O6H91_23G004200 [Diphasiastrum complanatum]|uniref:Uncharacterized protein n=1 Tax=Diphasiastrum complanatum TaxID=34168 RepID=A0ACC2A8V5_DIPCM|nr:hypothetical protein O6H91_23G004200 [Diphasiastrum complanatum]
MLSERTRLVFSPPGVCMLDVMPALVKNGSVCFRKYEERQWMKGLGFSNKTNLKTAKRLDYRFLRKYRVRSHSSKSSHAFSSCIKNQLDRRKGLTVCKLLGKFSDSPTSSDSVPLSEGKELQSNTGMRPVGTSSTECEPCTDLHQTSANENNILTSDIDCSSRESQAAFWQENDLRKRISSVIRVLSGSSVSETDVSSGIPVELHKESKGFKDLASKFLRLLDGTNPSPLEPRRRKLRSILRRMEEEFFQFAGLLGTYICIITGTGAILATGMQLSGDIHQESILWFSWLAGVILGSMIGSNQVLESQAKAGPRNVVITGSTRGLGKALAREFLRAGDNVVVASRSPESVRSAVTELQEELKKRNGSMQLKEQEDGDSWFVKAEKGKLKVVGTNCDVSDSEQVQALGSLAVRELGSIDIWINNAGMNKGFRPFVEFSNEEIEQIISTNLLGSIICTREAIRIMKSQPKKGHIFNMDGAGSDGASTPLTAVYGASKSGLRQFHASLLKECRRSRVGIHTASPGMVLTDLLLSGSSLQNKKVFNFICEQPETVARALVPKMRAIKGTGQAINYLTPPRLIIAIVTAWLRRGRWFDEEGKAVYAAEADRLRMWAEERQRSHITAAMEMVPSSAWVSLFSSSVICAYIILSSSSSSNMPGT